MGNKIGITNIEWSASMHIADIKKGYESLLKNPGCKLIRWSHKESDGTIHHFMSELTYKIEPTESTKNVKSPNT